MAKTTNTTTATAGDVTPPPQTLGDAIQQNALAGISSSSGDGQSMTAHNLRDQIEADKYLAAKQAARRPLGGMRLVKIVNGSAL